MIPVYRIEEHNEAYAVWHMAVDEGFLAPSGNLLLHVDHHDDLSFGGYWHDFSVPVSTGEQARRMVKETLGIADFIIPALWDGLFDHMINFKSIFPVLKAPQSKAVLLQGRSVLKARDYFPLMDGANEKLRRVTYQELSLTKPEPIEQPVVLDIDLDYFCWDNSLSTGVPARVEISREDYEAIVSNPRHPLRILATRIAFVEEEGGSFFLNIREKGPERKETREERIRQRIDKFFTWLKENEIRPVLIDVCRSRISGYCPADRWELIETLVLQELEKLYEIELRDELLERL